MIDCSSSTLLTQAVQPDASDVISEAWFYVATHFLTEIWNRRCWHQKAGIFFLIFSQKMGINILGGPLRKSNRAGSPPNTMWPGPRPTSMPSFILIRPFGHNTPTLQSDRTDRQNRQRTDSIGRTVLQTVAQKRKIFLHLFVSICTC